MATETSTRLFRACTVIARVFVKCTETALFSDPQITVSELASETGLSMEDTRDALYGLSVFFNVTHDRVLPQDTLRVRSPLEAVGPVAGCIAAGSGYRE